MANHLRRSAGAAAGVALAFLLSAACFSGDPDSMVGPGSDCDLALDGSVTGTTTTIVQIVDFGFVPAEVTIPAGTSVTWVYCEPTGTDQHTATADDDGFDSGLLGAGASFTVRFDEAGTHPYHCEPHPFMRGTVTVE